MDAPAPNFRQRLEARCRCLKRDATALFLAMRHPATPWYAKALAAGVVAYALSPIDLIPDPIPVLGLLDDLLIVPLGVLAVRWLIPRAVFDECRLRADQGVGIPPAWRWAGAILVIALWLACLALLALWAWRHMGL